jgi:superfamily I DNA and/or RNA helicase
VTRNSSTFSTFSTAFSTFFPLRPYLLFNLLHTTEQRNPNEGPNAMSCFNTEEATFVVQLCIEILKLVSVASIGVVTPYRAHQDLILSMMNSVSIDEKGVISRKDNDIVNVFGTMASQQDGQLDANGNILPAVDDDLISSTENLKLCCGRKAKGRRTTPAARRKMLSHVVDVRTIDSFQGGEKDVIIFSCVRAPAAAVDANSAAAPQSIGFVGDLQRMKCGADSRSRGAVRRRRLEDFEG